MPAYGVPWAVWLSELGLLEPEPHRAEAQAWPWEQGCPAMPELDGWPVAFRKVEFALRVLFVQL